MVLRLAALLLLLVASPAWAAIADLSSQHVTNAACDNTGTCAAGYPGSVTSGNLLVCGGANWNGSDNSLSGVADTVGSTWTTRTVVTSNHRGFLVWAKAAASGANTVTVSLTSSTSYASMSCAEFSGVDTTTPLDVDGGSSLGTSATPSMSITTGTANALIVGVLAHSSGDTTLAPGGSYTQIGEQESNVAHTAHNLEFRIVTTATSYTVDWTTGIAVNFAIYLASFRQASAAAGTRQRCVGCGADGKVIE